MRREAVEKPHTHTHTLYKDVYLISTPLNNLLMTHISYDPMATPTPYTALPRAASALLFIEHCYGFCQSFTRSLFCWFILYLIFRLDIRHCWLPNQFANAILLIVFNIRYTNNNVIQQQLRLWVSCHYTTTTYYLA